MKQKRLRSLAAGAALLLTAAGLTACAGDGASEGGTDGGGEQTSKIRVATSVSNSFPFIVVQAAEQLGTWKDSGLEVEVIEGTTPTMGQIMAGGQADIALAASGTEAASRESGVEMTMIASNLSYWDQRIIAAPGTGSVEDLKGGNFGITGAGSPGEYTVRKLAEAQGWSESDYTLTSLGNLQALNAAMSAGQIDAFAWSSQAAFQLEDTGEATIVADGADFVGDNVLQAFAVMDDFAAENPDTVKKFFEAYFATVERIQADPQLFIDVLVNDWEVSESVAQRLAEESLPELSADGVITEAELEGIRDATAFSLDVEVDDIEPVAYTYWKDLK